MLCMVRHTKIRSKLQILKCISDKRDAPNQRWQGRLPVSTQTGVRIGYAQSKNVVNSFARLLETVARYLAPLKDLELNRRAARARTADATSHASPAGCSTTENKAFICTGSAVAQQDADGNLWRQCCLVFLSF